jgi:hypothetical protein
LINQRFKETLVLKGPIGLQTGEVIPLNPVAVDTLGCKFGLGRSENLMISVS